MRFYYSNYWGFWSRILQDEYTALIQLTPINHSKREWDELGSIMCGCMETTTLIPSGKTTKLKPFLPLMEQNLSPEVIQALFGDFDISYSDVRKAMDRSNGGWQPLQHVLNIRAGLNSYYIRS